MSNQLTVQSINLPVQILSKEDYDRGMTALVAMADLAKKIHEHYDPLIAEAHAHHKSIIAARNEHLDPLHDAEQKLKTTMAMFVADQKKAIETSNEFSTEDQFFEALAAPVELPKPLKGVMTDWDFRILHPEELPREYLMPDTKKIAKTVMNLKGLTSIPGVDVFEVNRIRVSR